MEERNEPLKREYRLEINEFNESAYMDGPLALAKLVENLLLLEPGTYPSNRRMGVGIQTYKFEQMTEDTMERLRSEIMNQIREFLPDSGINNVVVQKLDEDQFGEKALGVMVEFDREIDGSDAAIIVLQQRGSKKTISQIYV